MVKYIFILLTALCVFGQKAIASSNSYMNVTILSDYLYPKSEILVQVKIYSDVPDLMGEAPELRLVGVDNYTIDKLKKVHVGEYQMGSDEYIVGEYLYSLFVSRPGTYTIDSILFEGTSRGESISLNSSPVVFDVLDYPPGMKVWRSAYKVYALSGFNIKSDTITVGEVVRASIFLEVDGGNSLSFPELVAPDVLGAKSYIMPLKQDISPGNENLILQQRYNFVFVPEKEGTMVIPDFKFEWMDLGTNQIKETIIQGRIFNVKPGKKMVEKGVDGKNMMFKFTMNHFYFLMFAVVIVLLGGKYLYAYKLNKKQREAYRKLYRKLKFACIRNDCRKVIKHSLSILDIEGIKDVYNITEMAKLLNDDALSQEVVQINYALFKEPETWSGRYYYNIFIKALEKYKATIKKQEKFPGLYPIN